MKANPKGTVVVCVVAWAFAAAWVMAGERAAPGNQGIELPAQLAEGGTIEMVYIHVVNPPDKAEAARELRAQVESAFGTKAGDRFTIVLAEQGLKRVRALSSIERAEYRIYRSTASGSFIVAVIVGFNPTPADREGKKGWLASGDWRQIPLLYEGPQAKLSAYVNGGVGAFSDFNPWFGSAGEFTAGSPIAEDPADRDNATWVEFYVEPGLYGISQLGGSPWYLYGDVSVLMTVAWGQDLFVSDQRRYFDIEKAYAGVLYAPMGEGSQPRFNLSAGQQSFELNDGFMISRYSGSANAGERASLYLNSRTAFENTAMGSLQMGNFRLQGFFLEPQEIDLDAAQTDTQIAGAQVRYQHGRAVNVGLTGMGVPQSKASYRLPGDQRQQREGLWVVNPHLYIPDVLGWWFRTEYAHEDNDNFDMSAHAAYGVLGHIFRDRLWKPNLSYRYAWFSGDDPDTATYERFDPLLSGGLSEWVQGITMKKVTGNANLISHRARLTVNPKSAVEVSLDYFFLQADELNNRGGAAPLQTLTSKDLGQEITLTTKWPLNRNLFLLAVLSQAFPGEAIRDIPGDQENWLTCQASLFFNF